MHVIDWAITQQDPSIGITPQFARHLGPVGNELSERVSAAIRAYPCDVLFVHRDSESESLEKRESEIASAFTELTHNHVPIIPMRMTEAWLLSDEHAIRSAAGNPNGKAELGIPGKREWERSKNPKQILFDALKAASELNARALKKFSPDRQRLRVAELTTDFSGLRGLASFDQFEATLKSKLFGEK
ncbi:DUF4276 family protein [Herbaspirillum sp. WGmk3]|uniref:DUF4276 family protein n=1 Tax=Herbaspirillum sp. WGmk3 TaxID=2919925 RepID=UPI00209177AF|nr:DUF4276 family protein [Herbaspirillum sp. WGmk3]MCO4858941.1 DUF4276 family protein [Herbaspirillum sp. WGmk3]